VLTKSGVSVLHIVSRLTMMKLHGRIEGNAVIQSLLCALYSVNQNS